MRFDAADPNTRGMVTPDARTGRDATKPGVQCTAGVFGPRAPGLQARLNRSSTSRLVPTGSASNACITLESSTFCGARPHAARAREKTRLKAEAYEADRASAGQTVLPEVELCWWRVGLY